MSNPISNKNNTTKTLIILDWDDTLFPTTWAVKNGIDVANTLVQNKYIIFFAKLDLILEKMLTIMLDNATVVIVTNAMEKWVNVSSQIIPNTKKLIQKNIKIISARDKFKKIYPDNTFWKKLVFKQLMIDYSKFNPDHIGVKNIISIGDADYELHALINLYDEFGEVNKYYKSVKLLSDPSYDTIIDQLEVLHKTTTKMINLKKHLDLKFINIVQKN